MDEAGLRKDEDETARSTELQSASGPFVSMGGPVPMPSRIIPTLSAATCNLLSGHESAMKPPCRLLHRGRPLKYSCGDLPGHLNVPSGVLSSPFTPSRVACLPWIPPA